MKILCMFAKPLQIAAAAFLVVLAAVQFSPVAQAQAQAKPLKKV